MPAVVVLCLNKRRKTIKFPPSFTVYQILDQVCKKENLNPNEYELRTNSGPLDNSILWSFTNLPNNAKLELHPASNKSYKSKPVEIALQMDGGTRLQARFQTTSTLKDVVTVFEEDITKCSKPENHVAVVVYMRQEVTEEMFSKTTLGGLGISGRALLRLKFAPLKDNCATTDEMSDVPGTSSQNKSLNKGSETIPKIAEEEISAKGALVPQNLQTENQQTLTNENTDEVLDDPMEESSQKNSIRDQRKIPEKMFVQKHCEENKTMEVDTQEKFAGPSETTTIAVTDKNTLSEEAPLQPPMEKNTSPNVLKKVKFSKGEIVSSEVPSSSTDGMSYLTHLSEPCDRQPILYHESSIPETVDNDVKDEFFNVTMKDLRMVISDLKRQQSEEENLMVGAQRDQQKAALIMKHPKVLVRFVFPTRHVLQGWFQPLEPIAALYDFVSMYIKKIEFYLFTAPPKNTLSKKNETVYDCGLSPASKVFWGSNSKSFAENDILESALQKLSNFEEANSAISKAYSPSSANLSN